MIIDGVLKEIKTLDFDLQFRLIPLGILPRLKDDMDKHRFCGPAGQLIETYYMHYSFEPPQGYQSILVVSYPQPHAQIKVETEDDTKPDGDRTFNNITIPSGYYNPNFADHVQVEILTALEQNGISGKRAHLPLKLLGARSGLTKYGKNNISYVKPYGSQHRLMAFYTDAEAPNVIWEEEIHMDECSHCMACVKACPYGAIKEEDGLIDPNLCLSFYMDLLDTLPPWVNKTKVNALIGCTYCQDACQMNGYFTPNTREILATISKTQVDEIHEVDRFEDLSPSTKALVQILGFDDSYALLKRNMGVL